MESISNAIGVAISTVHGWLLRLEEGGLKRRHDRKSPGRPCRLSDRQWAALDRDVDKDPTESGFFRDTWTGRLVARRILNKCGIKYSDSGALKLTRRMNFSVRGVGPVPHNSATAKELEEYVEETVRQVREHDRNGFKIVFIDFAGFADSPASRRGIRRRGGRDTVRTNCSKKTVKVAGALGKGTLDIQFRESANTEGAKAILGHLRRKYGKVYAIMDNAGAHTSQEMNRYIESTKGDTVRRFLPPRTPQHNSIEVEWRELKGALSATFFGGFDELQRRIRQLLRSGEVAIAKLIHYVFEAIGPQSGPWKKARRIPMEPPNRTARPAINPAMPRPERAATCQWLCPSFLGQKIPRERPGLPEIIGRITPTRCGTLAAMLTGVRRAVTVLNLLGRFSEPLIRLLRSRSCWSQR